MKRAYKSNPVFEIKHATKAGHWTPEEHLAFVKGYIRTHKIGLQLHGKNWKDIRKLVPTRSSSQIRTHAQKFFLKIGAEVKVPDSLAYVKSRPAEDFVDNKKPYAKLTVGKLKEGAVLRGSMGEEEKSEMREASKEKQIETPPAINHVIKVDPIRRPINENSMSYINNFTDNFRLLLNISVNLNELYGRITGQWLLLHSQVCRKQQEELLAHLSACTGRLSKISTELSSTMRLLKKPTEDQMKLRLNETNQRFFI